MSGMHLRFRKSFPIIPKVLYFTLSKKSVSMQLRLGPFSKSWGSKEDSFAIDAPGELGLGMKKRSRHKHDPDGPKRHRPSRVLAHLVLITLALALFARLYYHLLTDCSLSGHPGITLLVLSVVMIGGFEILWRAAESVRGPLLFLLACASTWVIWTQIYPWLINASVHCP